VDGYFPRGRSVLRQVHEERAVGLHYGQRALCIGALKPLNYVGTSEHSRHRETPFKRLAHTATMFEAVFFGSREEADRVLATVERMHQKVKGELAEDAGTHYPKGTPYSAFDPELMLWTVAVIADSAACFYELLVRRLSGKELEALWQDYLLFGELFGMPRAAAPATWQEFREYWDTSLAGEDLHLTPEARYVGHATAFEIPMPATHQPAKRIHDLIMLGSMPPRVRELYGLRWTRAHAAAFRAAVRVARTGRGLLPHPVTRGYNTRFFDLVAETERRRIAAGKPTPQVSPAVSRCPYLSTGAAGVPGSGSR
jgi:uncharacterized protein (DUF2236 family)